MQTRKRTRALLALLCAAILALGCQGLGARLPDKLCRISFQLDRRKDIHTEPPNKVRLSFALQTCRGEPVPGLQSSDFALFENGKPISTYESRVQIRSDAQDYEFESLLLLDLSGSIIGSGNLAPLLNAAQGFVEELAPRQKMAVYYFDGRAEIFAVVDFTDDLGKLKRGIQSLQGHQIGHPGTNLYGATVRGIEMLDRRQQGHTGLYDSALIVFTDGTNRARPDWPIWEDVVEWFKGLGGKRPAPPFPSKRRVLRTVRRSDHSVYTIGLGGEIDKRVLKRIGRDGFVSAANVAGLPDAFDRLIDYANSVYRVTYISPTQRGMSWLKVQVRQNDLRGTYRCLFNARRQPKE